MNPDILPTQKEWQLVCKMTKQQRELTDEEIISEWIGNDRNYYNFARAILKKASEK
jgi:formylglycine-generating enzyme required for sulfatase activity